MSESPNNPEALLHRLEWTVIRRLDGLLHGDYRTLFRGQGVDLAGLREYQYDDDVRHIDWNVTARLQTPHVRVFNEERDLDAWLLLDLSASLDFGSRQTSKRDISAEFVAVLARVMGRHGNRVGAMLYGTEVEEVIAPRSGRRQALHIVHALMARQARRQRLAAEPAQRRDGSGVRQEHGHGTGEQRRTAGRAADAASHGTDLDVLLRTAQQGIPRRSLVFVVSDFISVPGWEQTLARLSLRHEVLAVRLYDELEMRVPDLGMVTMQDPETGEQLFVDTHARGFRQRYAALADQREEGLRSAFRAAGVDVLELATDDSVLEAIVRFADLRRQRARMTAGAIPTHLESA
ncbi:MAG: DUF58 domain-containing protein [Janthinobacterium lividum]